MALISAFFIHFCILEEPTCFKVVKHLYLPPQSAVCVELFEGYWTHFTALEANPIEKLRYEQLDILHDRKLKLCVIYCFFFKKKKIQTLTCVGPGMQDRTLSMFSEVTSTSSTATSTSPGHRQDTFISSKPGAGVVNTKYWQTQQLLLRLTSSVPHKNHISSNLKTDTRSGRERLTADPLGKNTRKRTIITKTF